MEKKNLNLFLMLLGSFALGGATGAYLILNMINKSESDNQTDDKPYRSYQEPNYESDDEPNGEPYNELDNELAYK